MHYLSTYSQEPPVKRPPLLIARSHITSELFTIYVALYSLMRKLNLTGNEVATFSFKALTVTVSKQCIVRVII